MLYRQLLAVALTASLLATGCSDDAATSPTDAGADATTDTGTADTRMDADPDTGDSSTPDADPDTGSADTGSDRDTGVADVGDTGASPDGDDGADTGGTCSSDARDSDWDGLTDCEERAIGTNPNDADTDDDGLSDGDEYLGGTDPFVADSDGDGLDDGAEGPLGLDPTREDTFGDGVLDGDRWIASACDEPQGEPVDYYTSFNGHWLLALPPAFANQSELTITGADDANRIAASVYDDPSNEVAGLLVSQTEASGAAGPVDVLRDRRAQMLRLTDVNSRPDREFTGGEFATYDFKRAASGEYLITTSGLSPRELRDQLLYAFGDFAPSDVTAGMVDADGASYTQYRVFISVIWRPAHSSMPQPQVMTSVALAPAIRYDATDAVGFRMDDLTNTTNVADRGDTQALRCQHFVPTAQPPIADFYWVLDQSGSMGSYYDEVRAVANLFYARLNNTSLDYRLGVTPMDIDHGGRLRPHIGWHTGLATFLGEIDDVERGGYHGSAEYGLTAARDGIKYMKGLLPQQPPQDIEIRSNATLITVFMADEEAQTIQDDPLGTVDGDRILNDFINFFTQHTTAFAIVGDGNGCGMSDGEAYRRVATATGGSFTSLCNTSMRETIENIIDAAVSQASNYRLPNTPISSTLRVWVDGEWVPRSRQNGFDYSSRDNTIVFYGDHRPPVPTDGEEPDYIVVEYESYVDKTKP